MGTGLLSYADYGIRLWGTSFDTGKGNDTITGTGSYVGFYNTFDSSFNTDEGNDTITGNTSANTGFINQGFRDTGDGNDIITGNHINEDEDEFNIWGVGFVNGSSMDPRSMDTGDSNDTIAGFSDVESGEGLQNYITIYTGNGNDTFNATGKLSGIRNEGTINTGNDRDSISSVEMLVTEGWCF